MMKNERQRFNCNIQNDLIKSSFEESSIHGMGQVVRPNLHLLERIFWLLIIISSITIAIIICLDQWVRYTENPTVLSLETDYKNWQYKSFGITLCSNYTNEEIGTEIVERVWNVKKDDKLFEYYLEYVYTISTTNYNNLENFKKYENDETLKPADMVEIANEMKKLLSPSNYYTAVITDMGICYSTTKLYKYQSPYNKKIENLTVQIPEENPEICRSIDVCKSGVVPSNLDNSALIIYIHNVNDIISGRDTLNEKLDGETVIEYTLSISEIIATDALIKLSPERRKCLFHTEKNSPFFNVYTINLCKTTCRILAAIKLCKCRPFFYNIESSAPICTPSGLYCLSKKNWYDVTCICPELCETKIYSKVHSDTINFYHFNKMLIINTIFPRTRIKRNILFSFEDLLVSFGGAAALFLGFSFLSIVEFIFFLFEFIWEKIFFL